MDDAHLECRRNFLKFIAASPLLASFPAAAAYCKESTEESGSKAARSESSSVISSPDDAVNVFDFEPAARDNLPPAHWGYLKTGVRDDATVLANRTAFSKLYLRPRRLVDVSKIDTSMHLFGVRHETPIFLAPAGSQRAFHEDGELAVADAAKSKRHLMILSTVSTTSVEDVIEARGEPIWYQLYPTSQWEITRGLVKRAQAAGCPVLVLTVDQVTGRNRETLKRFVKSDTRKCSRCHSTKRGGYLRKRPMFDGLNTKTLKSTLAPDLTWEIVRRLRGETDMKIIIKGLVTREDARLCLEHKVDGIVVSNHGGRAEESGRGTLDSLPEVLEAVDGNIPVLIDGGFRRGMDIFKALALGAKAILIGRPYLWGLGAFGQPGVEKVLEILQLELELAMKNAGTRSIKEINRSYVGVA
ncbi:MAG: alpha-hydroxy acid oxidase [Vicinamibacteria bacterium]